MKIGKTAFGLTVAVLFLLPAWMPAAAADGMVAGTVTLEMEGGGVQPGNWIRILLVTRAVAVPKMKTALQPGAPGYVDAINSLHTKFYIQVQNHLAEDGYLYASTLTTDEGGFKLPAIAPGAYIVLVTFPDTIRGNKVAWQIPVKAAPGKTTTVNLTRSNLALPPLKS